MSATQERIRRGLFDNDLIRARVLSGRAGDWQSVHPSCCWMAVWTRSMAHKAETGDRTAKEYRGDYRIGYETEIDRIGNMGTRSGGPYADDGYAMLTYAKGSRVVRCVFEKKAGDRCARQFIRFSDHGIAPTDAGHSRRYWGNDRTALLADLSSRRPVIPPT